MFERCTSITGTSTADKLKLAAGRFDVVDCPGTRPANYPEPICIAIKGKP